MQSADADVFAIADAAGVGVYRARLDGVITAANDAFLRLLGHDRAALERGELDWRAMTPPEMLEACDALARVALADGSRYVRLDKHYLDRDGTPVPVAVSCALHPEDGYALCFVMDQRPRRHLEHQLREVQRFEPVARMATGVAHDVNNLLTIIGIQLDQAIRGADDSRQRERLNGALQAVERAGAVAGQLLGYGRARHHVGAIDLAALVRDAQPMLVALLGRCVRLRIALADGATVHGDRTGLLQVLLNLAANARDAMPEGGEFAIDVAVSGGEAVLVCRDTGTGMDEMTARSVFEPWFTTKGAGTGLGLAIVAGIVRDAGGAIALQSRPGAGTVFTVRLPLLAQVAGGAA